MVAARSRIRWCPGSASPRGSSLEAADRRMTSRRAEESGCRISSASRSEHHVGGRDSGAWSRPVSQRSARRALRLVAGMTRNLTPERSSSCVPRTATRPIGPSPSRPRNCEVAVGRCGRAIPPPPLPPGYRYWRTPPLRACRPRSPGRRVARGHKPRGRRAPRSKHDVEVGEPRASTRARCWSQQRVVR